MSLPHLNLAATVINYQCCCRRPVWKWCEISESETGTRRSSRPFSGTRPRSSSTASDLHLCTHLGEGKQVNFDPDFSGCGNNKEALCQREEFLTLADSPQPHDSQVASRRESE